MADRKRVVAVALAGMTLVVLVVVIAAGGALRAGLAPWPGIAVVVMAISAFAMTWPRGSLLVSVLLAASGLIGLVYGLLATEFLAAASFPGPIFGIIIGLPLLGLGVTHSVRSVTAAGALSP